MRAKGLKRNTASMSAGLKVLIDGPADFFVMARAGCNGAGTANMVKHGLANKLVVEGANKWLITEVGKTAFASGYYHPATSES